MSNLPKPILKRLRDLLDRMLDILPQSRDVDWSETMAATWQQDLAGGRFEPIEQISNIQLEDLLEIERQKQELVTNTEQFCAGLPANNALLWGARGTGKSSLIHAMLNEFAESGLRLVQVEKQDLVNIAAIARHLEKQDFRFLIVCDDLSFDENDSGYKQLKSALEGSVFVGSANILIYATSNRRHLITEYMQDNLASSQTRGELHESESIEEKVSLSDRFGLWLSFHQFKQDQYLNVVAYWVKKLAIDHGLKINWTQQLRRDSLTWALKRGVRSGRTAHHFARHHVGKTLLEYQQEDS